LAKKAAATLKVDAVGSGDEFQGDLVAEGLQHFAATSWLRGGVATSASFRGSSRPDWDLTAPGLREK